MKDLSNTAETPCFTNFAIQEYLMGRLSEEIRTELKLHVDDCLQCGACLKLMDTETIILRAALRDDFADSETSNMDPETLAMYLDDTLGNEQREECEKRLRSSPQLLASLLELKRELSLVQSIDPLESIAPTTPEGRILRMPKRRHLPKNLTELGQSDSEASEA